MGPRPGLRVWLAPDRHRKCWGKIRGWPGIDISPTQGPVRGQVRGFWKHRCYLAHRKPEEQGLSNLRSQRQNCAQTEAIC